MTRWEYAFCRILANNVISLAAGGEVKQFVDDLAKFQDSWWTDRPKGVKERVLFTNLANRLGAEGWELVSMTTRRIPVGRSDAVGISVTLDEAEMWAVFKRPVA